MSKFQTMVPAVFVGVLMAMQPVDSVADAFQSRITFDNDQEGELAIMIDGEQVAVYSYQDDEITRPYFAHLRPTNGPQVSRNHPPLPGKDRADHPTFHPGLWMAFGDISGSDYWRLAAPVKHERWIQEPTQANGSAKFAVLNRYLNQEDPTQTVCEEECRITIMPHKHGYMLLWDSTFSSDEEFYFGDQEEMGLGFRVATPIRVEKDAAGQMPPGNGTIRDSAGRKNEKEVWGNAADWCDYSGTLDGKHVGMTVFCHPENFRKCWFHARDYGFLAANPFGRKAFNKGEASKIIVKPDEELRLRFGVFVHASPEGQSPDLDDAYQQYLQAAGK